VNLLLILREIWQSRELLAQFVSRDLTVRYTQAVMGFAWALLVPLMVVAAGFLLRFAMATAAGTTLDGLNVAALLVKSLPWAFFSGAVAVATQSVLSHANLLGKLSFVRETLPIASVFAQGVDSLIAVVVVTVILPFLGVHPTWQLLWVIPIVALLVAFTCGCSLLLSCANLYFRDVKYIVQVALNFGVFATPVFIEPQFLGPAGAKVMLAIPLSPFIQAIDLAAVRGANLLEPLYHDTVLIWSPWLLLYSLVVALGTLGFGLLVFRRASRRFAEVA
jgi:lipopolysaccharide transport system permease protein